MASLRPISRMNPEVPSARKAYWVGKHPATSRHGAVGQEAIRHLAAPAANGARGRLRWAPLLLTLTLLVLWAMLGLAAAAPAAFVREDFLISPPDTRYHAGPTLALDGLGNALIVWQGEQGEAPGSDILGRRFGPGGPPGGALFRVNAEPAGEQRRPAVACNEPGDCVVVWDTDTSQVHARRFAADGTPLGDDLPISAGPPGRHFDAAVAVAADGAFVVAWEFSSGDDEGVLVRRFAADGTPRGDAVRPAEAPTGLAIQLNPALALLPDGGFALAWEELEFSGVTLRSALWLRRYNADGAPMDVALEVAAAPGEEQRDPTLVADPDGTLTLAWATHLAAGSDAIRVRRYTPAGEPSGPATTLSAPAPIVRFSPAVAAGAAGSILVAWAEPDGPVARRLDANGAVSGEPFFPRSSAPSRSVGRVAVASGPAAEAPLWLVWSQVAQSSAGGETASAVFGRRYGPGGYTVALPLLQR